MANKRLINLTSQATFTSTFYMEVDDAAFPETRKMLLSVLMASESAPRIAQDDVIEANVGLSTAGVFVPAANSWYMRNAEFTAGLTDRSGVPSGALTPTVLNALRLLDCAIHANTGLWEVGAGTSSVMQLGGTNQAIGDLSAAMGVTNIARGSYTVVGGSSNDIDGDSSAGFGNGNIITNTGSYGFVVNRHNIVSGSCAIAIGEYSTASGDYSFAGGHRVAGAFGAIASGEGSFCFGGGDTKDTEAAAGYSAILGGNDNEIGTGGTYSSIIAGKLNTINDDLCSICGGLSNTINNLGHKSFLGGGELNETTSTRTAIVGGYSNFIDATSDNSGIFVGSDNAIIGGASVILGGKDNIIGSDYSCIMAGSSNEISAGLSYNIIGSGKLNKITTGEYSGIIAGENHVIYSDNTVFCGGDGNTSQADADRSFIGGGKSCGVGHSIGDTDCAAFGSYTSARKFASLAMGSWACAYTKISKAHGGGDILGTALYRGSFQKLETPIYTFTTDATPANLYVLNTASSGKIKIPVDCTCNFVIEVCAVQTGGGSGTIGDSFRQTIKGCIKNIGGTTSIAGSTLAETAIKDAAFGGVIAVTADNPNSCIQIEATGEANKSISWTAFVTMIQVGYRNFNGL